MHKLFHPPQTLAINPIYAFFHLIGIYPLKTHQQGECEIFVISRTMVRLLKISPNNSKSTYIKLPFKFSMYLELHPGLILSQSGVY